MSFTGNGTHTIQTYTLLSTYKLGKPARPLAYPPARSTYAYKITYTHAYNIIRSQSKSYHMQPTLNAATTNPYHSIHTTLIHARLNKCTQLAPYRSVQIGHVWTSLMGLPRGFNLSSCSARTAYTGTPQIKRKNRLNRYELGTYIPVTTSQSPAYLREHWQNNSCWILLLSFSTLVDCDVEDSQ